MTVPRTLSDTSMSRPASRDGNEKSIWSIVKRTNQVNIGIFRQVIPGRAHVRDREQDVDAADGDRDDEHYQAEEGERRAGTRACSDVESGT